MTTDDTPPTDDSPDDDGVQLPPAYPDTTAGMLMRDRDQALASADAAQGQADQFAALATANRARAAALQVAIDSMPPDAGS
ncbi:hypothetical protein EDF51_106168 [Curtobacterium sp. PhB25]|uniref:hypothetical protein n=1 Tax=Curtobacterium sp. PhB25 TaxID=2485205 RepID=UPI001066DD53|nr:hypothetical protein [Curtobacterium sp. PhB25]TDW69184.1 hypothetical protein EDF51_106168 [Curtobacterium sp. PhB25]